MRSATIIGAGPAGSTSAILLARRGWNVTLVEQSRFPRDKVCGECLSALGFDVLTRVGLADSIREHGAIRLTRANIHAANGRTMSLDLPRPMWGFTRRTLDATLLDEARRAGATIRQPARCESIDGTTLRLRDLTTNVVETHSPAHVLVTDGKASFDNDAPAPTGDFGIKAHFTNVDGPRDAIELFGVRGSYGGLAAVEGNRWNAAFSVPAARIKSHRGDIETLFAEVKSENATLAKRLELAERVGPWLASPLPRFPVRASWQSGVIPVGNAAAAVEPIGGEGMGLALRSAELAAAWLIDGARDPRSLQRAYQRLWRTRRFACRAAGVAVSHRAVGNALVHPRVPAFATRAVLQLIGKH